MCEAFQVEELALRIRATRGRSSRPNPLKDQGDSRKALSPGAFRRFLGSLHSVAKQASFRVALRSDFRGFRSDFRRFWEAPMDAKIDFRDIFFRCFFRGGFDSDFGSFLKGSRPEK